MKLTMTRKVKHKLGDVVSIPLPDSRYAAGRLFRDASIGVFAVIFDKPPAIEDVANRPTAFVTGCFTSAIKDGHWKVIGTIPFSNDDEAWGPPTYIQDFINPKKFRIYHMGKMRPATADEVRGLGKAEMYKPEQLVDRILRELVQMANKINGEPTRMIETPKPSQRMKESKITKSRTK